MLEMESEQETKKIREQFFKTRSPIKGSTNSYSSRSLTPREKSTNSYNDLKRLDQFSFGKDIFSKHDTSTLNHSLENSYSVESSFEKDSSFRSPSSVLKKKKRSFLFRQLVDTKKQLQNLNNMLSNLQDSPLKNSSHSIDLSPPPPLSSPPPPSSQIDDLSSSVISDSNEKISANLENSQKLLVLKNKLESGKIIFFFHLCCSIGQDVQISTVLTCKKFSKIVHLAQHYLC